MAFIQKLSQVFKNIINLSAVNELFESIGIQLLFEKIENTIFKEDTNLWFNIKEFLSMCAQE